MTARKTSRTRTRAHREKIKLNHNFNRCYILNIGTNGMSIDPYVVHAALPIQQKPKADPAAAHPHAESTLYPVHAEAWYTAPFLSILLL
jgi:hypothetical protein